MDVLAYVNGIQRFDDVSLTAGCGALQRILRWS